LKTLWEKLGDVYGYAIKTPLNFIENKEKITYLFVIYINHYVIGNPLKTLVGKNYRRYHIIYNSPKAFRTNLRRIFGKPSGKNPSNTSILEKTP